MVEVMIERHDNWLKDDGPVALVLNRKLVPVEGSDAWIFPPTFAANETAEGTEEAGSGVYQIDELPNDPRRNVCVIDSVGSQANRMEPIFKLKPCSDLVPQVIVQVKKDGESVNLLDAGHRAADAAIRFSDTLGPKIWEAFKKYKTERDCSDLAKMAPTSLVFGVWDSRATGVKIQRIVRSIIRAYDVSKAMRSATYQAACDYTGHGAVDMKFDKGSGKDNPLSQEGFKYSLATNTHGGVLVKGEIKQEAVLNLVALRTLTGDLRTRRYILGLALVALSYRDQACFNLREGCLLCAASKEDYDGKWDMVMVDGSRVRQSLTYEATLEYAKAVALEFGVVPPVTYNFDSKTANAWLSIKKEKRKLIAKTKHPHDLPDQQNESSSEAGKSEAGSSGAAP